MTSVYIRLAEILNNDEYMLKILSFYNTIDEIESLIMWITSDYGTLLGMGAMYRYTNGKELEEGLEINPDFKLAYKNKLLYSVKSIKRTEVILEPI